MVKKNMDIVRSSAAEYLTFVAATGDSSNCYEMRYEDENIWLTQKMMAALYDVALPTINEHIKKIYADGELSKEATIRKFRIVQDEGTRQVNRELTHYNLQLIIAVGFKVNKQRAVQFRKWAGQIVKDHTIQGWTMDVERLKKGHMFTDEYFERQLQQIREIRLSERKFYQKVTDLYATAFDYDKNAKTTRLFFQTVQKKAISDAVPRDYFGAILEQCETKNVQIGNIIDEAELTKNLTENAIPVTVIHMDVKDYDAFLAERRKMMAAMIEKYYKSL
ncbi:RhuM family protein [uncultured Phascolarctobacterium sp.]|uniref:virulence RhuM family protein n=1 Tax=uncultured Phascolarctobacterium sp. TaxID=512296 RepID=UPI0034578424